MGLKARERHALYSIENRITGSDPRLASLLAMFTRLTASEALPVRENIRVGRLHLRWQYAWAMVWVITSVALIAVALAVGHAGAT